MKKLKTNIMVNKKSKKSKANSWQNVKIKGHVISEEGVGLEGLLGLEVMENYDDIVVHNRKQKPADYSKSSKKQPKMTTESDSDLNDDDDGDDDSKSSDSGIETKRRKMPNKRKSNHENLGINKAKQDRFRFVRAPENFNTENSCKKFKENKSKEFHTNEKKKPKDRFHLLRPPPETLDGEEAPEEGNDTLKAGVDDLEGWNGLGIPLPILKAIAECGFRSPTEIQALTLPAAILGRKDILGAAETGSGKTLAFGIPVLTGIMELKSKNQCHGIRKPMRKRQNANDDSDIVSPQFQSEIANTSSSEDEDANDVRKPLYAIILTPTRELAVQIRDHMLKIAKYTGIDVAVVFGGLSMAKQERILSKCPEIVVATPGRFWELYTEGHKHLRHLNDISFLVIDEADRMVEKGHFDELRNVLQVINANEMKKQSRQNFVFSATLTLVHDLPDHMKNKRGKYVKQTSDMKLENLIMELGISQPKIVDVTKSQQTAETLLECRLICSIDEKDYYLYYFVQMHPGRTIVFCNSIDCVKRLATLLNLLECQALPLHANMAQKQRLKNLERFRDNSNGLLIATDVAARGLDIPNVEHVIHYQVPRTSENYVHRSGRTARAKRNGITIIFMEPTEVKNYVKLCKTLKRNEDLPLFPIENKYLSGVKERVRLAREVDKEELKLKRTQTELGWMRKQAEDMDIIIDGYNDESGSDLDEDAFIIERRRNRLHLTEVRQRLKSLLAKPLFPKGFNFNYPTMNVQLQQPLKSAVEITDVDTKEDSKEQIQNSAVKAMQTAIAEMKLYKKECNKKRRKFK